MVSYTLFPRRSTTVLAWSVLNCCSVRTTILVLLRISPNMAWDKMAKLWLNHGEHVCRRGSKFCYFYRIDSSKVSVMLTLTWGNCEGSCSNYDWDSWVPCIALVAIRNVAQLPKRIETIQSIKHSAVVNACKNSGNIYYWSQVTMFIRRGTKFPYILYGTPSKFYIRPRTWHH